MVQDKLSMFKNLLKYCYESKNKYVFRSRISEAKFRLVDFGHKKYFRVYYGISATRILTALKHSSAILKTDW